jgi:hypothetical protein
LDINEPKTKPQVYWSVVKFSDNVRPSVITNVIIIWITQVCKGCLNTKKDAINLHRMLKGKIEIHNKVTVENVFDEENATLGLIYTPGVAYVATEINKNKKLVYDYTSKWNNVAIICDGTRVLGGKKNIATILQRKQPRGISRGKIPSMQQYS